MSVERSWQNLRVAFVTADANLGGAEKQMFYMARGLASAGAAVRVYNLRGGGYFADALAGCGIPCETIRPFPLPPARLWFVVNAMRKFRPHIVQSIHAYTNFYAAAAGRLLGALAIGGLREALEAHLERYGAAARLLLRMPDAIAVNSRRALDAMRERGLVDARRAHYLPNVIDLAGIRAGNREMGSCTAIAPGRLIPPKRVDRFLRALAIARRSEPSLRGLVAGYGPEEPRLRQIAAELGLSGAVAFSGRREGMADLFAASSIAVLCSETEGTPNVLLEAMAAGLPVITTPAGDAGEIVERAGAGFVVAGADPEAIANRISELARCESQRNEFGRSGRRYVERHHSAGNLGPALLSLYDKMARCARGARARRVRSMTAACAAARNRAAV